MATGNEWLDNARQLRRNMTRQERSLWYSYLRGYPIRFCRQRLMGKYVLDFYCPRARLAVELDGSQHYMEDGQAQDALRTAALEKHGIQVLRFSNTDVDRQLATVCQMILDTVQVRLGQNTDR